jgi:hypothetical protein
LILGLAIRLGVLESSHMSVKAVGHWIRKVILKATTGRLCSQLPVGVVGRGKEKDEHHGFDENE